MKRHGGCEIVILLLVVIHSHDFGQSLFQGLEIPVKYGFLASAVALHKFSDVSVRTVPPSADTYFYTVDRGWLGQQCLDITDIMRLIFVKHIGPVAAYYTAGLGCCL